MSEQQPPSDENRHERAEVARLIAEHHRETAEEQRNIKEDMRQVAEELRDSAEAQREVVAQKWHESASEGRHADREALGQLKEHVYRLEGRVSAIESLLRTLIAEQNQGTADERILQSRAIVEKVQEMTRDAQQRRKNMHHLRGKRDE
jgi:hypothetical protein